MIEENFVTFVVAVFLSLCLAFQTVTLIDMRRDIRVLESRAHRHDVALECLTVRDLPAAYREAYCP